MAKSADEFFSFAKRDTPWSIGNAKTAQAPSAVKLPEGSMLPPDLEIRQGLEEIAARHKINPAILMAMAHQESMYNPGAIGPDTKWGRAEGMFQFLKSTAEGHGIDAFDWRQAGEAAAKDLAAQIAKMGVDWAVAHHHAGSDPKQHGPKTAQYTREVLAKAAAIAEELGIPLDIPAEQMPNFGALDLDTSSKMSAEDFFAGEDFSNVESTVRSTEQEAGIGEESFMDTVRRRMHPSSPGANPVADAIVSGITNTVERGWEGIQNFINRETQVVERTDDELRRLWETEGRNSPQVLRHGTTFEQWASNKRNVSVSTKPFALEEAEWAKRLQENPEDARLLPRRLAHLRPKADDSRFAPSNTFKGVMQRFAANHRNPIDLMLQESIPADLVSYLFTLPELERKKFDQARAVSKAMEVTSSPDQYTEEELADAQAKIGDWRKSVDTSVSAAWDQMWQAAKEDPSTVLTGLSEALWADPYMAAAPVGVGLKPVRTLQAASKIGAPTIAGRAGKIADAIIDGSITTAAINVAAGAADNLSEFGKINDSEAKLNAAVGALTGGALGPIFMRGAKARMKTVDAHRAQGTLDEALRDMAKADVEMEAQADFIYQRYEDGFGTGDNLSPTQQRLAELLGIQTHKDATAWKNQRRKEVKDAFSNQPEYADYLRYVAEERIARTELLVAEREAEVRRKAEAAYGSTPETSAARTTRLAEEFEAAVAARNAAEAAGDLDASWRAAQAEDQAFNLARQLDAEEMYYAQLSQDTPTIRQTEAKIARRNDALGRHRRKRNELGAADPKVLAVMGITAAGATAGAAMFPKEPEKGMLAGVILSGLSAVGLGKARGGRSPGSLRRISQEGAIKPKGGNWSDASAGRLSPDPVDTTYIPESDFPDTRHIVNATQRYLQRYAGTADDPLNDIRLPDGTRWEDAMDLAIRKSPQANEYGEHLYNFGMPVGSRSMKELDEFITGAPADAVRKIRDYMNHVRDYLDTLPESEVMKMDFVRMVKETKRWDEANARKMEKAQVKFFKDAEVLREYDDGFKWIRLNKPGQFANESDLMGHSVRGYEPSAKREDFDYDAMPPDEGGPGMREYVAHADWIPESIGGNPDYGYGGWEAIKNDKARVYSLRDSKGKPVATVELGKSHLDGSWELSQVKGPRNEPVKKIYGDKIADIIEDMQREFPLNVEYAEPDLINSNFPDPQGRFEEIIYGPRRQRGSADPKTLARLGVVAGGAAAGYALFPEDEKLSGALLGGLAGLLAPAGGSVLSRMRQAGAIDPNGNIIAGLVKAGKMANKLDEAEINARDTAWIDATRAGDQRAFKALYDAYKPSIERYSKRFTQNLESRTAIDAEDIAQRAMLDLYQATLDPEFKPEKGVGAWLRDVAYKRATDELRKSSATKRDANVVNESQHYKEDLYEGDMGSSRSVLDETTGVDDFSQETINQLPETPENARYREELLDVIRQELDKLPPKHQQLFAMTQLDHFDLREAAEQLGISYDNARQISSRVERSVRNAITENRRKLGEEPDLSSMGMARGQRGAASPELLAKTAAVVSVATAAGTAGYFLSDGDPWKSVVSGAGVGAIGLGLAKGKLRGSGNVIKGDLGGANPVAVAIRSLDYRLKDMSEALWGLAKKHGQQELRHIKEYNDATAKFIHIFEALPKDIKPIIIDALSTRDKGIINKMLEQVGGKEFVDAFDSVRKKLDEVEDNLVELGLIKKSEKDYFPFRVKDLEGLKKHLGKEAASEIDEALAKAQRALKKRGDDRPLTEIEKSIVINKVLEPYLGKPISAHTPGFARARTIQRITPELQKFYHDPVATLNSYGVQSIKYIERAKFFGKHLKRTKNDQGNLAVNIGDSIGELVNDLKKRGEITDDQAVQLAGMLQDRFNGGEMASHKVIQGTKNLTNAMLLGHIASAVVQIGDILIQANRQGLGASVRAARRMITRDKLVDLKNYGLTDHVAHEFLSDNWTRKVADWSFKWGGFRAVDHTGKNFGLNAAVEKMMKEAQSPQGVLRLSDRFQRAFPEDFQKGLAALKKGEVNEAVELMAFAELTHTQPVTSWELPQYYQRMPNGRVIYHLQTFSMRVMNMVYEDALKDMFSGNAKRVFKGSQRLLSIGAVLGVQGVVSDKIKDFVAGKPIELSPEEIPINALEALGMNLYDYNRIKDKGPLGGFVESKMPPIVRMSQDVLNEPERSTRFIPVAGRAVYDRNKDYFEQRRRERRKRQGYKMEITVPPKKEGSSSSSGRGSRGSRGDRGGR